MNVIVVSYDCVAVRIVAGWVVVLILGLLGCWGGDKTYLQVIVAQPTIFSGMWLRDSFAIFHEEGQGKKIVIKVIKSSQIIRLD